jgi:hypothetical protein
MGTYSRQELDAMVREQAAFTDARERVEAEQTPVAYMLRVRAEEVFRRVPLGEGRLIIPILQSIRQNLTTFIERGIDVPAEAAQDIDQAIRACEEIKVA